ncbi:Kelch repeat-containing protein [Salinimicrobium sp. WS361]|uniref:Kelch repeat-containing protein n=1 Tax=Salinimicrobium sp. WS361 TaxID=3425123 RepID=UPI003D6F4E83
MKQLELNERNIAGLTFIDMSSVKLLLLLTLFCCSSISSSQTLHGVIKDIGTKKPLSDVHITSSAITNSTISGEEGEFVLELKELVSPTDSISFSYIGYTTLAMSLKELGRSGNEIFLRPEVDQLSEVNLDSKRLLSKTLKFSEIASLKKGVNSFGSIDLGNKIYVIAGDASVVEEPIKEAMATTLGEPTLSDIMSISRANFSMPEYSEDVQVYNELTDEWTISPIKVSKRAGHNAVLHKNKIYVLGGKHLNHSGQKVLLSTTIEVIDLQKDTLLVDRVYPHQASGAAVVIHGNDLLVLGGSTRLNSRRKKIFTDEVHLFNFLTGLWFEAGKLPERKEIKAVNIQGKIFIIGGSDGSVPNSIESLDLTTGKYKTEAKLQYGFNNPGVVSNGNIIYVYESGKFHAIDVEKREMRTYRIDLQVEEPNLHILNHKLFVIGGYKEQLYTKTPVTMCYKIALEEFNKTEVKENVFF